MAVVSRGVQVVVAETATRLSSHFRSGGHGQTLSRTVARVADARRPSGGCHLGASQCCGRDARPRSAADTSRRGTWRVGGWLRPVSLSPSLTGVFRVPSGGLPLPVPPVLSGPLEGQLALPLDEGRVTLSLGRAVLSPSHSALRLLCSQPQGRLEHPPVLSWGTQSFQPASLVGSWLCPRRQPAGHCQPRAARPDPSLLLCTAAARWAPLGGQRQFDRGQGVGEGSAPALHWGRVISEPRSPFRGGRCPAGQSHRAWGPSWG